MCPHRGEFDPGESDAGPSRQRAMGGVSGNGRQEVIHGDSTSSTLDPPSIVEAGPSSSSTHHTRRSPPPYEHVSTSTAHIAGLSESGRVSGSEGNDRAAGDRSLGMHRPGADGGRGVFDAYREVEGRESYRPGSVIGHGQKRDRGDRMAGASGSGTRLAGGDAAALINAPTPRYSKVPPHRGASSSNTQVGNNSFAPDSASITTPASMSTHTTTPTGAIRSDTSSRSNSTTTTPSTTSTPYFEASTRSSFSTAFMPTSPVASSSRHWVPTSNVPEHISRRHHRTGGGSRWLSEDEGIGGSGLARRRGSAGASGSGPRPGAGSGAESGSGAVQARGTGLGIGMSGRDEQEQHRVPRRAAPAPLPLDNNAHPSTAQHMPSTQAHDNQAGPSRRYKPPLIKHPSEVRSTHNDRSSSTSHNSHGHSHLQTTENGGRRISSPAFPSVPADLPQIRNLLPRTTVPGLTASGLTSDDPVGTLAMRGGADLPDPPVSPKDTSAARWTQGDAPPSADSEMDEIDALKAHHHGHGVLGNGHAEKVWWNDQSEKENELRPGETERQRSKRELVGKLRRLMACNLCPPGTLKTFHHPLTLPCGHTLSSDHLTIPCPAPLALPANTAAHEIYAAEQKQHAQRLSLWAGVMCPIPTCKRYSPYAVNDIAHEPVSPTTAFRSMSAPTVGTGTGRGPPTVMSSGVTYYPSQMPAPPYSTDMPFHEVGSPLLDTAVDKVLGLVLLATGEEGEAYSRTFSVDKGKDAAVLNKGGSEDHGEMEVEEEVNLGGQTASTHPAASGAVGTGGSVTAQNVTESGALDDIVHPVSPVSSTTRSPSFKRPRNRLGTDSSSSIESASGDTPAFGDDAISASGSHVHPGHQHADPGTAIESETSGLGRPNSSDPMLGVNDVISPTDRMTRPSIPHQSHPSLAGHAYEGGGHDTSASTSASTSTSTSASGSASAHASASAATQVEGHSLSGKTAKPSNVSDKDDGSVEVFKADLMGVLECDVCTQLLFEPVTTPCQHSFCSKCIARSLDHSQRCPVCRQNLPSFAFFTEHTVNRVLLTVLKTAFPTEYAERAAAIEKDERDARLNTPIFVCTLAFPGMPTILHVFEPRYRLMIRRCIESDTPRFGMVLPSRASRAGQNGGAGGGMFPIMPTDNVPAGPEPAQGEAMANTAAAAEAALAGGELGGIGGVMEYGTMLEIQSVQMLPDGRSMVETVGTHRFRLLEKGSLDGYTVGRVERIDDIPPEEEAALEAEAVRAAKAAKDARAAHTRTLFGHRFGSGGGRSPEMAAVPGAPLASMPVGPSASAMPAQAAQVNGIPQFPQHPPHPPHPSHATPTSPSGHTPINLMNDTPHSTVELMNICRSFIDQLRSGSAPWLLQRLNNTYGSMPTDPSEFSYWMALVMPIDEFEKARLLPIRSPRLRLKLIVHWVESLRSSWWFSSG